MRISTSGPVFNSKSTTCQGVCLLGFLLWCRTICGRPNLAWCWLLFSLHLVVLYAKVDLFPVKGISGFMFDVFNHLDVKFMLIRLCILVCRMQINKKWCQYILCIHFWCTLCCFYGLLHLIGLLIHELNSFIELT